ncbi:MAG TPA: hypothetical protein DDW76_38320 [Cyanobacteria bacterium UBA11369]|nr:hypothetical protein [Cyanobacteria bacterium UBA11371]HBE37055.1 hypothetical protein [Cyanobacteria bacterium UBA11368]HBE54452.1 hypothetical protein [Cyanobacteria bacterium UBA11369]
MDNCGAKAPALNFSRYFVSVLALPVVMTEPYPRLSSQYPDAVNLLETQRFATRSNLEFCIDSQV